MVKKTFYDCTLYVSLYRYRVSDVSNDFFCLQKRRGHGEGKGWAAKVIGTLDNFRDTKVREGERILVVKRVTYRERQTDRRRHKKREEERDRERETDRQTDTDRQTKKTEKKIETERQTDIKKVCM